MAETRLKLLNTFLTRANAEWAEAAAPSFTHARAWGQVDDWWARSEEGGRARTEVLSLLRRGEVIVLKSDNNNKLWTLLMCSISSLSSVEPAQFFWLPTPAAAVTVVTVYIIEWQPLHHTASSQVALQIICGEDAVSAADAAALPPGTTPPDM